jgi:hypothetical protein
METGVVFSARQLHTKRYYQMLLDDPATPANIRPMFRILRQLQSSLNEAQKTIFRTLEGAPELRDRLQVLQTIPGVGPRWAT